MEFREGTWEGPGRGIGGSNKRQFVSLGVSWSLRPRQKGDRHHKKTLSGFMFRTQGLAPGTRKAAARVKC